MSFDWKTTLKSLAPVLAGVLTTVGGPAGALAGAGLTAVAGALGVEPSESAVSAALQAGLTPEQRANLAQADLALKQSLISAGLEEKRIAAQTEGAYLADIESARAHNAQTHGILILGYVINIFSYCTIGLVLYGCFAFATNGALDALDSSAVLAIGGIVGAAVQWLMQNAAQANSFFFGSSPGSRQSIGALADSVAKASQSLSGKASR